MTVEMSLDQEPKEGTLVLVGFLGRGNTGDEAMLQVLFEAFSPRFDIAISLDKHGAHERTKGWYPYTQARIFHQNDCNVTERVHQPVGVLVGGGSLSLGFAAGIVLVGRSRRVPAALAGVDIWQPDADPHSPQRAALTTWLGLFDDVIPRTRRSLTGLRALGLDPLYGADWALRLPMDEAPDIVPDESRALVVLREGLPGVAARTMPPGRMT
ncbi:MAG: hypothetical protein ACJ8AI_23690 [Rhodopila sp.]